MIAQCDRYTVAVGTAALVVVTALISLGDRPARAADEGGFETGDAVQVDWNGLWRSATIKDAKGDQYKIGYDGWPEDFDEWVAAGRVRGTGGAKPARAGGRKAAPDQQKQPADAGDASTTAFAAGQSVEVKKGKNWYPAMILLQKGDESYIHYSGKDKKFDEWVAADRVRPPTAPANKTKSTQSKSTARGAAKPAPGDPRSATVSDPDWSQMVRVDLDAVPATYGLAIDPSPQTKVRLRPIELKHDTTWDSAVSGFGRHKRSPIAAGGFVAFTRPAATEALVVQLERHALQDPVSRIVRCDLSTGKSTASIVLPKGFVPLDVSPSGERIVGWNSSSNFNDNQSRVDVFALDGDQWQHVKSWVPYQEYESRKRGLEAVMFVDDERVATRSGGNKMVVWEVATARAVYWLPLFGGDATLSPTGKYLAVRTKERMILIDPPTGKPLAALPLPQHHFTAALAFDPSGQYLASSGGSMVVVWDLVTGQVHRQIWVGESHSLGSLEWVGDGCMLAGDTQLIDVQRGCVLWSYDALSIEASGASAGRLWIVETAWRKPSVLAPLKLPHETALAAAKGIDPESLFAVKPGAKVSIEANLPVTAAELQAIVEPLQSQLEAAGLQVVDGQPLKLVLNVAAGPTEEVTYSQTGGGETKHSRQTWKSTIEFALDGRPMWTLQSTPGAAMMVSVPADKTLNEVLAAGNKPNMNIFHNVVLPQRLQLPQYMQGLGRSALGIQGVHDYSPEELSNSPPK